MPLLAISAHLDDAALSCAWRLAGEPGGVVATAFTAIPQDQALLTDWDRECGFTSSADAMRVRLTEDLEFARAIGCEAVWLHLVDKQYATAADLSAAVQAFTQLFEKYPDHTVLLPLGLKHPDHVLCHRAAITALRRIGRAREVWCYEDVPYRTIPRVLDKRRRELSKQGVKVFECQEVIGNPDHKATLLGHYASQYKRLDVDEVVDLDDAFAPERYWRCVV